MSSKIIQDKTQEQKNEEKKVFDIHAIHAIEKKWRDFWDKEKIYKFDLNDKKKKIFAIDTPPPTVSGEMHIGHACSYSQQDFIARFKRMRGFNVFYPFGTDDNGLPTEKLVEKRYNIKAKDMPREEFIKLCLSFLSKELPKFVQDWKNLGISCDWSLAYSTIDSHSRRIAQWSFLDLYKKGRLYRKEAPAMWCPECKTSVAQVEVQDKEIETTFNYIRFKIKDDSRNKDKSDDNNEIIIATTRPELLPACVAIFYNPNDSRYKKFKNKKAIVPLFNFEVPIMEDNRVLIDKGSGIVMCCTFGDQIDMEWQKAYNLPIKIAIDSDGKLTPLAGKYAGLSIKEAREKIILDLEREGFLKEKKPIKHAVNVHERCKTEIEFIKSKQWFVKYLDLKEEMLKWGNEFKWYPDYMKHRYEHWVKGLQWDWLISNQRHFGVPFPVWYCKNCGEVILAKENQLPVDPLTETPKTEKCPKCSCNEFLPEKDVLNTWFTSSMTPQIAIQLIKDKKMQKKLFPMDLRPQAHEIITFWLFNTVVKSHLHFNQKPWKNAMISGFVTLEGEKMSKSKGNIIRPQDVMEKYGVDSIRFWAASSKLGEDFDYQEKDLLSGYKTIIKLWNAANFLAPHLTNPKKPRKLEAFDLWLINQLNALIKESTNAFENYEYSRAKSAIEQFFWHIFCDNYLEIIKNRIYQGNKLERASAIFTLYTSFLTILKLIAPFMPHITEELYQKYFRKYEKDKSIHISSWPYIKKMSLNNKGLSPLKLLECGNLALDIINRVRQFKAKEKKSLKTKIILTLEKKDIQKLNLFIKDLKTVTSAAEIKEGNFNIAFCE